MYSRNELVNIHTKCVFQEKTKEDMCNMATIGQEQLSKFMEERITTGQVNLWDPIKKLNLSTCKQSIKKAHIKMQDSILELKQDRQLFSRMLIVMRSAITNFLLYLGQCLLLTGQCCTAALRAS